MIVPLLKYKCFCDGILEFQIQGSFLWLFIYKRKNNNNKNNNNISEKLYYYAESA